MSPNTIALVTTLAAAVAALAAFLAPWATRSAAQIQFRLGVAQFRQQWINSLRQQISEFLTHVSFVGYDRRFQHEHPAQVLARVETATRLQTTIALMLNRRDGDHARLLQLLDDLLGEVTSNPDPANDTRAQSLAKECTRLSQDVLKREWD